MCRITGVAAAGMLLCVACDRILAIPADPRVMGEDGAVPGDEPWGCYLDPPELSPATSDLTRIRLRACDYLAGTDCDDLVEGLTGTLCSRIDPRCDRPLATDIEAPSGQFDFEVPTSSNGFNGYLLITGERRSCTDATVFGDPSAFCALSPGCDPVNPDERCLIPEVIDTLYLFNPPVREPPPQPLEVSMLPTLALPTLASLIDGLDPASRGFLLLLARDCDGERAAGVRFRVSPEDDLTTIVYGAGGGLSATASETDATGSAGIAVKPGLVDVFAETSDGERLASVSVSADLLRVTYIEIAPVPP